MDDRFVFYTVALASQVDVMCWRLCLAYYMREIFSTNTELSVKYYYVTAKICLFWQTMSKMLLMWGVLCHFSLHLIQNVLLDCIENNLCQ